MYLDIIILIPPTIFYPILSEIELEINYIFSESKIYPPLNSNYQYFH